MTEIGGYIEFVSYRLPVLHESAVKMNLWKTSNFRTCLSSKNQRNYAYLESGVIMKKYSNKKLLILGTNVGSVDIAKYAKSHGAYVIGTDNLPKEKSDVKQIADEALMISTANVDELIEYVIRENVSAVFCGVSEFNIKSAKRVCDVTGLPFYFSWKQWNAFMDKSRFRQLCTDYDVPSPKTYFYGNKEKYDHFDTTTIEYPVIVKPTDSGANIGISITYSKEEIDECVKKAIGLSETGNVIIEQYIDGVEISCTYVIQNGVCKLVCMGSKYAYTNEHGLKALSHAYVYPSPVINKYVEEVDDKIKKMIVGQGINNCTIFFQGIYDNKSFYIFESGLRMEGTASYRITNAMTGQNFMHFMVDNIFGIETDYEVAKEDPYFQGKKCIIFTQIASGGTLSRIEGWDYIKSEQTIISSEQRHKIGDYIANDGTLRQIMFRYVLSDESMDKIINVIRNIQNNVKAFDKSGMDMLIKGFDPTILNNIEN